MGLLRAWPRDDKKRACLRCNGTGKVWVPLADRAKRSGKAERKCPTCLGKKVI